MAGYDTSERFEGVWGGEEVHPKRIWGGHRFSDDEVQALLDGELVELIDLTSNKSGQLYSVRGRLSHQTFVGDDGKEHQFVGFEPVEFAKTIPNQWANHTFTDAERTALENGEKVSLEGCVSKKGNTFDCEMTFDRWTGLEPIFPSRD